MKEEKPAVYALSLQGYGLYFYDVDCWLKHICLSFKDLDPADHPTWCHDSLAALAIFFYNSDVWFHRVCLNVWTSVLESGQYLKARIQSNELLLSMFNVFNVSDVNCCHYYSEPYLKKSLWNRINYFAASRDVLINNF